MYAMIYELHFWPHITDAEVEFVYQKLTCWLRDAPGFLGAALFRRDTAGTDLIVTTWRDATSAQCACGIYLFDVANYVNPLVSTPPNIHGYTVIEEDCPAQVPAGRLAQRA